MENRSIGRWNGVITFSIAAGLLAIASHGALAASRYQQGIEYSHIKKESKLAPANERAEKKLDETPLLQSLKGIIIVHSPRQVRKAGARAVGVEVKGDNVPDGVVAAAAQYIGKPVSLASLDKLTRDMVLAYRRAGMPVVNVVIPPQDITGGTVQIVAVVAHMGQLRISGNASNPDYYTADWPLARGDVIEEAAVLDYLRWKSRRFFRQVNAVYSPGTRFSETDVTLDVEETKPWMIFVGTDNTGQRHSLGEYRFFAGFMVGDLWGLDHEFSYQFTTSDKFVDNLAAHVLSYTLPVYGRTDLRLLGSYVKSKSPVSGAGTSKGKSYQLSAVFMSQLPRFSGISWDLHYGFEYKNSDNDFDFGGTTASTTKTEVGQFVAKLLGQSSYAVGRTNFQVGVWASPGKIFSHQTDADYHTMRANASADYLYVKASVDQVFYLPEDLLLSMQFTAQASGKRLLPSEMFYLGGMNTVRGFDESVVRGDNGILGRVELHSPKISLLHEMDAGLEDSLRFFGFLDFGAVKVNGTPTATEGDGKAFIMGAGVGMAYQISNNFSMEMAYGWKLDEDELSKQRDGRAGAFHLRVIARY